MSGANNCRLITTTTTTQPFVFGPGDVVKSIPSSSLSTDIIKRHPDMLALSHLIDPKPASSRYIRYGVWCRLSKREGPDGRQIPARPSQQNDDDGKHGLGSARMEQEHKCMLSPSCWTWRKKPLLPN